MKFDEVNTFILSFPGVEIDPTVSSDKLVYRFNGQMFAVIDKNKIPLRISLRCDEELSKLLRQKYDEVMPGDHLDKQSWNTVVLTGQLEEQDIKDLIRHSYLIVESGAATDTGL